MSATRPDTIGGTISVSDSQSLALLNVEGLPPGTTVWNEDVGAFFKLTTCARREITLDETDGYAAGVWTFANGDFTADDEEDTLVVRLDYPNAGYNANYFIVSVDSATEITVLPEPADASTFPLVGAVTVVDTGPSEADVVVSVEGGNVFGVVWRKVVAAEAVNAETADAPADAAAFTALLNVATTSLKGLQSAADKAREDQMFGRFMPKQGTAIANSASVTIQPFTDKASLYYISALSQGMTLTLGNDNAPGAGILWYLHIVLLANAAFQVVVRRADSGALYTIDVSQTVPVRLECYCNNGTWAANTIQYVNG